MEPKKVSNFYFFEARWTKVSAWSPGYIPRKHKSYCSIFCIVGTASFPLFPEYHRWDSKKSLRQREAYNKKVKNFISKRNVFHIGTYWKNLNKQNFSIKQANFETGYNFENVSPVFQDHAFDLDKHKNRLSFMTLCESCGAKAGSPCAFKSGKKTSFHKSRKQKFVTMPFSIGKNRNGNGEYFFYKNELFLSSTLESVLDLFKNEQKVHSDSNNNVRERIPDDTQIFVWNRDNGKCVKCGTNQNLAFDHIVPHSLGGSNSRRNLQLLCDSCNSKKGNKIGG